MTYRNLTIALSLAKERRKSRGDPPGRPYNYLTADY
jgi:hypothetical protein